MKPGEAVHLADLERGKPIVLVLVQYGCPSLCTVELNGMLGTFKVIPQNIGDQYDVWAVSFDPSETPKLAAAKKRDYLHDYTHTRPAAIHASEGWHFLTGDASQIQKLTDTVGFHYRWDDHTQQFVHPAGLVILTPQGAISRYFFGVDFEPTDLRLSLVEASGGKIGAITDQVLLFCYHYDPSTGKYTFAVGNALRVGAALTVLLLAGAMGMLWRADRRRTRRLLKIAAESPAWESSVPLPDGEGGALHG